MAGNNASEIRVAGTGRILVAEVGAALPTTFTDNPATDWGAGWTDLGYTSTDGVTFSKKDKLDPVETWQSISPARFVYADRDLTLKFSMLQFNEDTLPFFLGGKKTDFRNDATNNPGVYEFDVPDGPTFDERALGLEFTDGSAVTYRFVIPRGQVTATDDLKLARKAAAMLGVTFTALSPGEGQALATFVMKDGAYAAV
ncbi:phage tail protein [Streptomyces sp. R302]|uniref:phage tail tube protein n=1 Tax=unclassified Streptomyces TaxID=2593676 RepID=UPI00145CC70F|nr:MULTISPECIES: phage tail protein [unclassified Streptomyces]NML50348.1 phage tail protein [Streptomyces sp. R301]NML79339.1 phage tail protein [Streptomyces sp. R302]